MTYMSEGFLLTDWSTQLHVYSAIDKKILVYLKKKTRHIIGYFKRDGKDIKEKLKYKTEQLQLQIKKISKLFHKICRLQCKTNDQLCEPNCYLFKSR